MNLKIKKKTLLIDQHDKNFMYGGKFGGNYIPETLKKPIDCLLYTSPSPRDLSTSRMPSSA